VGYWPYITVGGKYGTSIIIRGNLKALPQFAQGIIHRYFNRWRSLYDPTSFPDLLTELRGLKPAIKVDNAAVERYNKYIEIHTIVLSASESEAKEGRNSGIAQVMASKKGDRTTPRLGAILRAFCDENGILREPARVWEMAERIREADGLVEYDARFTSAFRKLAVETVVFLPSVYFKYQIEVGYHPKILKPKFLEILNPHLEKWPFIERGGRQSARWLLKSAAAVTELAGNLRQAGCNVYLYYEAWGNVRREFLLAGEAPPDAPVPTVKPVRVSDSDYGKRAYSTKAIMEDDLSACTSATLYPFQQIGVRHLVHTGQAMLADDMGLGKSVQAIAAIRVLAERERLYRALIICPASLKYQWKNEIERFTDLSPTVVEGDKDTRVALYRHQAQHRYELERWPMKKLPQVFIVNYELSFRDEKGLRELKPDAIILDEAQRIKNWQSKTHQAIVNLPARFRFVLSGTPLENELMELFNVLQFVDKGVLGANPIEARKRYTVFDKFGGIDGYQNLREASRRISGVSLRRTREEALEELPELIESHYWLELETDQRKIYKDLEERARDYLSVKEWDRVAYDNALTTVQRLREVCDTPEMLFPEHKQSAKLKELKVILGEQVGEMRRQAIVFTQWTRMAEILERELTSWGLTYRYMHGGLNARTRTQICEEFNRGDADIFLSTDAGSAGINLQAASIVVNFDLPFNPAIVDQRVARAHRHGQKSSVNAWHLVVRGTIEENLVRILRRRRTLFQDIFSEVGDGTAHLSASSKGKTFLIELLGKRVPAL